MIRQQNPPEQSSEGISVGHADTVVLVNARDTRVQPEEESERKEPHENEWLDVVGLRIPRKRILAILDVNINVGDLPRRKPHVTFETDTEDETL